MAYIGNFPASTQTVDFKWQSVQTSAFSAVTGKGYFVNTTSGAITVTLPSSANVGDAIAIVDYAGTFATNNITLTSSLNIEGGAFDKILTTNREGVTITYADATQGWVATSGVNSGDQALDPVPYSVDFLVIAGGGGGGHCATNRGGGGGGAGGYRNSYNNEQSGGGGSSESSLTFNPGTVYTITVGAGGSSVTNGVNSSLSGTGLTTITSTGGGYGGVASDSANSGGSGGGRGNNAGSLAGSGTANQGFAGGATNIDNNPPFIGTGGGGAGAIGGNASISPSVAGAGGVGLASLITGSSVNRGGGGGGAGTPSTSGGTASFGGGAGNGSGTATAGTDNTGGGGGAGLSVGASGGSGVVILRMPTANYSSTTTGSPTVSTDGTDTILIYNASGSYTG
jgi:hypothetical protein